MDNPNTDNGTAAEAKQRMPKHFHAGPNPVEGAEEEEKRSAVRLEPNAASPISRLYADTLGVVFDFLDLGELHPALCVSRSWLSAVCRTPCLRLELALTCTSQSLVDVSSSRLSRHIGEIRTQLTSNELSFLALSMPQLLFMQCEVMPSDARKMILPPKLWRLDLDLGALDAVGFNTAAQAIGQLTALVELTLRFSTWLSEMSLAPLSKCATLEQLTVNAPPGGKWRTQPTDAHIDQLRALTHLRWVAIPRLTSSSLAKLLRSPHSLQWMEMTGVASMDSASAAALRNLPGLLTLGSRGCRDVSFLPVMTQLQVLNLEIKRGPWAVTGDALVEALSNCRQLTMLFLVAAVTSKHLAQLLPHLPLLHSVLLRSCDELESLSFLSDVPALQTSLHLFHLDRCCHPGLRPAELRHVVALKELTQLVLRESLASPLDDFTLHQLTPTSSVLPKLATFDYHPPASAAADP